MEATDEGDEKPVRWMGRSREDLRDFPDDARRNIGYVLSFAQRGEKHPSSKPLKGFKEKNKDEGSPKDEKTR